MYLEHRNNDAVLTVCQNNDAKTITISGANRTACELTGLEPADLLGKSLESFLPKRIIELLHEYVEFGNNANDVGAVLGKVSSFSLLDKNGMEKSYKIKVMQIDSGAGSLFFSLMLRDSTEMRKSEAAIKVIQENFKGHESIDLPTGLPDRNSFIKSMDLMRRYSNSGSVEACFAVLQIDDSTAVKEQYGSDIFNKIIKHTAFIAQQSLRSDDVLASVGNCRIGVLLVGANYNSARMVFNRLRWQIAASPYILPDETPIGFSVSMVFGTIDGSKEGAELLKASEDSLSETSNSNILLEAAI